MPRYILTGAPGTGKTSIVSAIGDSVGTVPEPARQVLREHARVSTTRLDSQPELFVSSLLERSLENYHSADPETITLFDRGIPDVIAYALISDASPDEATAAALRFRYEPIVFIAPLWEEIYTTDDLRNATFDQIALFDEALRDAYDSVGYQLVELPLTTVEERVDFVLGSLRQR